MASPVAIQWTYNLPKSLPVLLTMATISQTPAGKMRKVSNLGCALALGHQLHPQPQARSLGNAPANAASGMTWTRGVCSGVWLQAWPDSQPFQAKGLPPAGLPERQTEKKKTLLAAQTFLPAGARSLPRTPPLTRPLEEQILQVFLSSCL